MEGNRIDTRIDIRDAEVICPFGSSLRERQTHRPPVLILRFKCRSGSGWKALGEQRSGGRTPLVRLTGEPRHREEGLLSGEERKKSFQAKETVHSLVWRYEHVCHYCGVVRSLWLEQEMYVGRQEGGGLCKQAL